MKLGIITFTFDDGYQKVFETVPALLEKYNLRGVFAVAINHERIEQTENRPVAPWQEWVKLKSRGHEIAAHSVNHLNLTELSAEKLDQELKEPYEKLGAATLVYPGGAFNDAVAQTTKKYYSAARTVKRGFEKFPPENPMQLKSYNWTRKNFSVTKSNLLALWACLTNSWLIETFHLIDDNDKELIHSVKISQLDKHLKFVSRLPIHVKTISQIIGSDNYRERSG